VEPVVNPACGRVHPLGSIAQIDRRRCWQLSTEWNKITAMPKPNYQFEKRRREMEKKAKKEEKKLRKAETQQVTQPDTPENSSPGAGQHESAKND